MPMQRSASSCNNPVTCQFPGCPPLPLQYYDMASVSMRNVVWPLMATGISGFKARQLLLGMCVAAHAARCPAAPASCSLADPLDRLDSRALCPWLPLWWRSPIKFWQAGTSRHRGSGYPKQAKMRRMTTITLISEQGWDQRHCLHQFGATAAYQAQNKPCTSVVSCAPLAEYTPLTGAQGDGRSAVGPTQAGRGRSGSATSVSSPPRRQAGYTPGGHGAPHGARKLRAEHPPVCYSGKASAGPQPWSTGYCCLCTSSSRYITQQVWCCLGGLPTCAVQEDFKPLVTSTSGFEYVPERPDAPTFSGQKWGWTGLTPGADPGRAVCFGAVMPALSFCPKLPVLGQPDCRIDR